MASEAMLNYQRVSPNQNQTPVIWGHSKGLHLHELQVALFLCACVLAE